MSKFIIGSCLIVTAALGVTALTGNTGMGIAAGAIVLVLLPPKYDPAIIIIKESQYRPESETDACFNELEAARRADIAAIENGICPDCGETGHLCAGPSGGMSMNVLCDSCFMEFNVHHSFDGVIAVDRTGKATGDRALVFGVTIPEQTT